MPGMRKRKRNLFRWIWKTAYMQRLRKTDRLCAMHVVGRSRIRYALTRINRKFQITNIKYDSTELVAGQANHNDRNSKFQTRIWPWRKNVPTGLVIEYWNLRFTLRLCSGWWACRTICNLVLGIWDFSSWCLDIVFCIKYKRIIIKTLR